MLKPSYAELMDIMNKDKEGGSSVTSRYSVVLAAAKRARQLIAGDSPMVDCEGISDKPLSIAVKEIEKGKIKVVPEGKGTEIHIESESLEEEIKNELERGLHENEEGSDEAMTDSEDEIEDNGEYGEDEYEDIDILDIDDEE